MSDEPYDADDRDMPMGDAETEAPIDEVTDQSGDADGTTNSKGRKVRVLQYTRSDLMI